MFVVCVSNPADMYTCNVHCKYFNRASICVKSFHAGTTAGYFEKVSKIRSSTKGHADLTSTPVATEDIGTFALAMSELYLCEEVGLYRYNS